MKLDLKAWLEKVSSWINTEKDWVDVPNISYTVTTGSNPDSLKVSTKGKLIAFEVRGFYRAASTGAGGNMWVANLSGLPGSFVNMTGAVYYDSTAVIVYFNSTSSTTAQITARVIAASMPANGKTNIWCITRLS